MVLLTVMGGACLRKTDLRLGIFGRKTCVRIASDHLFSLMLQIRDCSVDVAHGYMSNSEIEKAVKEFGQRCSNISRIYR